MKHEPDFRKFLNDEVNLNQTRLDKLVEHVNAVNGYLSKKLDSYDGIERQGSWALGTIIKPVKENQEYDADLLLKMTTGPDWEPRDCINAVYECFRANDLYSAKAKRRTRCVTLDYAGDVHLDIVPCVSTVSGLWICNYDTNGYEQTDGTGYRDWFNARNANTGGNLKRAVRLLKYMRDSKRRFSVKSIVLTTLVGNAAGDGGDFSSIPATLNTVMSEIDKFLQVNKRMPEIANPALPSETFTRHWDESQYGRFREEFHRYAGRVSDAIAEKDYNTSIEKWREVFGDGFGETKSAGTTSRQGPVRVSAKKPWAQ